MFTTRKNLSKTLVAFTLAIAAAAVLTSSAAAKYGDSRPQGYQGVTQQDAGSGGVTPTDLARAVPRESNASGGVTPTDLARSVPSTSETAVVSESVKSDSFWSSADRDLAFGFGLGLALAIIGSVALVMARNRTRIAHS
jgi:hypothetical protein